MASILLVWNHTRWRLQMGHLAHGCRLVVLAHLVDWLLELGAWLGSTNDTTLHGYRSKESLCALASRPVVILARSGSAPRWAVLGQRLMLWRPLEQIKLES